MRIFDAGFNARLPQKRPSIIRPGGGVNPWGDDFVMTVQTTGTPETFTIPCSNTGVYNATIDWGDGTADSTITTYNDADLAHSYAVPGTYTIRISGQLPSISFNNAGDCLKVRTVEQMGRVGWVGFSNSFFGCSGVTKFIAGNCDLTGDISWSGTFRGMSGLTTLNLGGLSAVRPTSLANCFLGVSSLASLSFAGFDFSVNTNNSGAFREMTALTTLTLPNNFVSTACNTISNMFYLTAALETFNTTGWNTSAVTNFGNAFRGMGTLDVDISGFRFDAASTISLFMNGTTLTTAQYDAALIEWDGIDAPNSLNWDFGTSQYTGGGAAATARAALVATDLWVITDGGIA